MRASQNLSAGQGRRLQIVVRSAYFAMTKGGLQGHVVNLPHHTTRALYQSNRSGHVGQQGKTKVAAGLMALIARTGSAAAGGGKGG